MMTVVSLVLIAGFAMACPKCQNKGTIIKMVECPLCEGQKDVSPAWFGKSIGNHRWTETTYWTGIKQESNHRDHHFKFLSCPCCKNSTKKGQISTMEYCECGKITPATIKTAKMKVSGYIRTNNVKNINLDDVSDETIVRVAHEIRNWQATPKVFGKLLKSALDGEYDTEEANCNRENVKKAK